MSFYIIFSHTIVLSYPCSYSVETLSNFFSTSVFPTLCVNRAACTGMGGCYLLEHRWLVLGYALKICDNLFPWLPIISSSLSYFWFMLPKIDILGKNQRQPVSCTIFVVSKHSTPWLTLVWFYFWCDSHIFWQKLNNNNKIKTLSSP